MKALRPILAAAWLTFAWSAAHAQTTTILTPTPVQHFQDSNNNPCSGCKVFTYQAGTTTKQNTYTDSSGGTPNTNPVVLNSRGEAPIWLTPGQGYKFVLSPATDTDPPTNPIWTVDQIYAPGSGSSGGGPGALATIAALRSNTAIFNNTVDVESYKTVGDGGGGWFTYDSTDTTTGDNNCTVFVDASNHRWKRVSKRAFVNVRWCGAQGDDSADDTAAFVAAQALTDGTGWTVYVPAGEYNIATGSSPTVSINNSFETWYGDGTSAIIIPRYQGCPFAIGDAAGAVNDIELRGFIIEAGATQTTGYGVCFKNGARLSAENIALVSYYNGVQIGSAAYTVGLPSIVTLTNVHGGVANNGIDIPGGPAGVAIRGNNTIGGVQGANGRGINIGGDIDGLYIDPNFTLSDFDTGIYIGHTSGSVANLELDGSITTPEFAFVRINISGTASIGFMQIDGARWYDRTGSGDAEGLLVNNTGSGAINDISIKNLYTRDIRQRVLDFDALVNSIYVNGLDSLNSSAKLTNTYPAIDFNSLAHGRVTMSNLRLGGADSHGSAVPSYGIANGNAIVVFTIQGVDAGDAGTSPYTNMGAIGNTRKLVTVNNTGL